jgi:hypothetical protein
MDEAGMTDVPMRLLIAGILTSLMVPIVMGAYQDLSCRVAEDRALAQMERIVRAARSVMDADAGSTIEVRIDVSGFGSAPFQEGTIGGAVGAYPDAGAYSIVIEFSNLGRVSTSPDPPIAMTRGEGGSGLQLREGAMVLVVTHSLIGGMHVASFVEA